jgi:hypothetical protein
MIELITRMLEQINIADFPLKEEGDHFRGHQQ